MNDLNASIDRLLSAYALIQLTGFQSYEIAKEQFISSINSHIEERIKRNDDPKDPPK